MKNNIITKKLNTLQFLELRDFMQNCIENSIAILRRNYDGANYAYHLAWFKDCEMDDYFVEWSTIWDDDKNEEVGEGLDTVAHKFVLNDETRDDFLYAFELARNAAFTQADEDFSNFAD